MFIYLLVDVVVIVVSECFHVLESNLLQSITIGIYEMKNNSLNVEDPVEVYKFEYLYLYHKNVELFQQSSNNKRLILI